MADQHEPDPYALPPGLEAERLRSLERLGLLHTPPEDRFGYITRMARTALGVPMSAINFIDRDRQWCIQFSADHVLDFNVPREQSVSRATIARAYQEPEDLAVVFEDLAESEFAELPAVAADGGVRFYAGFPLFGPGGHPVGTFCIYDSQPRQLTLAQRATFAELAAWAQREIESSDRLHAVETAQTLLRATVDSVLDPQMLLEAVRDPAGRVVDFIYREANAAACKDMATTREELLGRRVIELLPGFAESGPLSYYAQCLETGQPGALDDYCYDHEIQASSRRYDIRIAPAGEDLISLTFRDVTDRFQAAQSAVQARNLLHATVDSMLTPQMLLEAVRDPAGQVVDFVYRSVNLAFCSYRGWEERDIVGQSLLQAQPSLLSSGLFVKYVHCVDTGDSVILDDFAMFNAMLGEDRRYDIRVVRAGVDLVSLTFGDVTDRFCAAQLLADSEEHFRLLAENSSDAILHARDGRVVWVSPSIVDVLGAPPKHWLGSRLRDTVPAEDLPEHDRRMRSLAEGHAVQERIRLVAANGIVHWVDLHSKVFYDAQGHPDGLCAALRLADREVATEQRAAEALRQRARADARFHRSMDTAAIAICIVAPDGSLIEVNAAMCELFGYDAATLVRKTWQELTAPEYLEADLKNVVDVLDGRIDSYRMLKQYIAADGRRIWGDLSVSCVRDETGQVESFVSQIADTTALIEATQQYRLLAENVGDLITHIRDGRFVWVSPSAQDVLGAPPEYWIGRPVRDIIPREDYAAFDERMAILAAGGTVQRRIRVKAADGVIHWIHAHASPFYDAEGQQDGYTGAMRVIDHEVAAEEELAEAHRRQAEADEQYRLITQNSLITTVLTTLDGSFVTANDAACDFFGCNADTLLTKRWQDFIPPDDVEREEALVVDLLAARTDSIQAIKPFIRADGREAWGNLQVICLRDLDGQPQRMIGQIVDVTDEVTTRAEAEEARRQQAKADALLRRSMESAAVGMCLASPDGSFFEVNKPICEFFGYDTETLLSKTWIELTHPDDLQADLDQVKELVAGRVDSYRMTKRFLHADGHTIWGDLSVGCLRATDGSVEMTIGQIVDITDGVHTHQRLVEQEAQNRALADQLTAEMSNAAEYVRSILPDDIHGAVEVTSRYLPALELGGDGFYYQWLDADYFQVYLLDVSGHGIRPALLSASVHNLIRSGSLSRSMLLNPERVLTRLNDLFQMEQQADSYFTMWYGVYQASTRKLRYASAGHPPALALSRDREIITVTSLDAASVPVGVFDDTTYTSATCTVPPGGQLLLYSDGAFELKNDTNDRYLLTNKNFITLCATLAARPDWSLDTLVNELRATSAHGEFDDDCALVLLTFP